MLFWLVKQLANKERVAEMHKTEDAGYEQYL